MGPFEASKFLLAPRLWHIVKHHSSERIYVHTSAGIDRKVQFMRRDVGLRVVRRQLPKRQIFHERDSVKLMSPVRHGTRHSSAASGAGTCAAGELSARRGAAAGFIQDPYEKMLAPLWLEQGRFLRSPEPCDAYRDMHPGRDGQERGDVLAACSGRRVVDL
jgi:hypothetical protein